MAPATTTTAATKQDPKSKAAAPQKDAAAAPKDQKKEPIISQGPHIHEVEQTVQQQQQAANQTFNRLGTENFEMRKSNASNASSSYEKAAALSGLYYYQKQLNKIEESKLTPGLMLECLLDDIEFNERKKDNKHFPAVNLTNFAQIEEKPVDAKIERRKSIRKNKPIESNVADKKAFEEANAKLVLPQEINSLKESFLEENTDEELRRIFLNYETLERDEFRCPVC